MLISAERGRRIPLQAAQLAMYLFEKLHPATAAYHHTIVSTLNGALNIPLFTQAVQSLMERHEALRYRLIEEGQQVYLAPRAKPFPLPFELIKFNPDSEQAEIPAVEDLGKTLKHINKEELITKPFNLHKGPLWRLVLVEFDDQHHQLLLVAHHIIVDVNAKNLLTGNISEFYNALLERRPHTLPAIPSLSEVKSQSDDRSKQEFWKKNLQGMIPLNLLPKSMTQSNFRCHGDRVTFTLDKALVDGMSALGAEQKSSLHRLFLTSLYVLLYRYTGQDDICIGTASANRRNYSVDVNNLVSSFVNSVPLRAKLDGQMSFIDLLQLLGPISVEAYKNQLPYDLIKEVVPNNVSPFDIIFDLIQLRTRLNLKDIQASYPSELNLGYSKFRYFGLNLDELPDDPNDKDKYRASYRAFIEYNTDLFDQETMIRLKDHLINIWISIVKNPHEKIADIDYLTQEEKYTLKRAHNTQVDNKEDPFVKDILGFIAKKHPNRKAVVFHKSVDENESLTYKELNTKAETLAALLRSVGVNPEKIVGICVARSLKLPIAIWGTLFANGALMPLESDSEAAIKFKLAEALPKLKAIIVDNSTIELFKDYANSITLINIDNWHGKQGIHDRAQKMGVWTNHYPLKKDNLAYITHTSGSTGLPKGVMSTQEGFSNAAMAIADRLLPDGCKVLCTAKPEFDAFFFEMLEALMTRGEPGELHLIFQEGRLQLSVLQSIIARHEINAVTLLPHISYLDFSALGSLIDIIIMGAIPNENHIQALKDLVAQRREQGRPLTVHGEYGVQESSIFSTYNPIEAHTPYNGIGHSIRNTQIFILDKDLNECAIGVPGQIYLAGKGLARGYLSRQDIVDKFLILEYNPDLHQFRSLPEEKSQALELKNDDTEMALNLNLPTNGNNELNFEMKEEAQKKTKRKLTESKPKKAKEDTNKRHKLEKEEPQGSNSNATSSSSSSSSSATTFNASSLISTLSSLSTITPLHKIRLYKTGDYAVRQADGSIVFIGRMEGNRQVKILGVRVELESTETVLQRHPNISGAHVQFNPQDESLRAYIILKNPDMRLDKQSLNAFLRLYPLPLVARLNALYTLRAFPLNDNGKINVSALDRDAISASPLFGAPLFNLNIRPTETPTTELENRLKNIWERTLGINIQNTQDSFIELGGNSLKFASLEIAINHDLPLINRISLVASDQTKFNQHNMTIKSLANYLQPSFMVFQQPLSLSSSLFQSSSSSSSLQPLPLPLPPTVFVQENSSITSSTERKNDLAM